MNENTTLLHQPSSKNDNSKKLKSGMVKVNNIHKNTTESQIYEHFSSCGIINRIFMDINPNSTINTTSCIIEYV